MGNGHRRANFIRLWSFEETKEDNSGPHQTNDQDKNDTDVHDSAHYRWADIQANILEFVFCEAFSTHHGVYRHDAGGIPADNIREPQRCGLNVMSPLIQRHGNMLSERTKSTSIAAVGKSPDRQIQHWAEFRPRQKNAK